VKLGILAFAFVFSFLPLRFAEAAITYVQGTAIAEGSSVADTSAAFSSNMAGAGSLIAVGFAIYDSAVPTSVSVSDSLGTTYTVYDVAMDGNRRLGIALGCTTVGGANTVTVNPEGNGFISFGAVEMTGACPSPLDVDDGMETGVANINGDATPISSITTTVANALVLAVLTSNDETGVVFLTPDAAWTSIFETENANTNQVISFVYAVVGAAGVYTPFWDYDGAAGTTWAVYTVSVKPFVSAVSARRRAVIVQ
jgi:hypothetical protein